jgi:peptide/nickel transport system ATP-binding protein
MVDACSRASILDYLMKLKEELQMTIVFVTHDIGLAYYVSDSIYIMHRGQIVEQGPPDQVTQSPSSPVTRRLLDDIPNVHHDWLQRELPAKRIARVPDLASSSRPLNSD